MRLGVLIGVILSLSAAAGGETSTSAQAAPFHVLRIAAGPGGAEADGSFVLREERSTFNRATDREVVVVFQWEGAPGAHRLEAKWRSPDGAFTSTSALDYTAKGRRFGAYWTLGITPEMTPGLWTIEATVDGLPGGRLQFEITNATVAPGAAPRRPLSARELYDRLAGVFVLLTRTTPGGRELDPAGGVLYQGAVLTTVRTLDETQHLHGHLPGGGRHELSTLVGLDRAAGWVRLAAPGGAGATQPRTANELQIGDRCYSMDGSATGARVLLEGQVTGRAPDGGLMVSFVSGAGTAGSPVVDAFGELAGLLGATALPQVYRLRPSGGTVDFGNMPMIPIAAIASRPAAPPTSVADARARGDLLAPLLNDQHVVSGGFATTVGRGPLVQPENQRSEFTSREERFSLFVTWSPHARLRGATTFRVYDETNRLVVESNSRKINLRPKELAITSWEIPVFKRPGTYRAELHLDGSPAWRDYVKIVP